MEPSPGILTGAGQVALWVPLLMLLFLFLRDSCYILSLTALGPDTRTQSIVTAGFV